MTATSATHLAPQLELGASPTRGMGAARDHQGNLFREPPFQELLAHYETGWLQKKSNYNTSQSSMLRQAAAWLKERRIAYPSALDWKTYLDWREDPRCPSRLTGKSVDVHRQAIQRVYLMCRNVPREGWLFIPNPVAVTVLGRYGTAERLRPRSMAEPFVTYPRLLEAMPDPRARALLALLYWHGPRICEALCVPLPGSEVDRQLGGKLLDLSARTLVISRQRDEKTWKHKKLKTEYSARRILLADEPVRFIREALTWKAQMDLAPTRAWTMRQRNAGRNYLFPYYEEELSGLMAIHREVAPEDFRPWERGVRGGDGWHVYRHTFATRMYRAGVGRDKLHELLRHSDMRTTDAYLRSLLEDVVAGDDVQAAWKVLEQQQAQAIAERTGRGPRLVTTEEKR